MSNPLFFLSLAAFVIAMGSGIYFLVWWLRDGKRHPFLLSIAFGLSSFQWFKIPNILSNGGVAITQTDFYSFFFVALLVYFLGYFALSDSLDALTGAPRRRWARPLPAAWLLLAIVYFGLAFFVPGFDVTYTPVWAGHLLFYIPMQLLIFHQIRRGVRQSEGVFSASRLGSIFASVGVAGLFVSSVLYIIVQAPTKPFAFWYFSVISSPSISLSQVVAGLFLFLGFFLLSKEYFRSAN